MLYLTTPINFSIFMCVCVWLRLLSKFSKLNPAENRDNTNSSAWDSTMICSKERNTAQTSLDHMDLPVTRCFLVPEASQCGCMKFLHFIGLHVSETFFIQPFSTVSYIFHNNTRKHARQAAS